MRKKIMIFILLFFTLFIFENIGAATKNCSYKSSEEGLTATYTIDSSGISRPKVRGGFFDSQDDDVYNWKEPLEGTDFTGKEYYNSTGNCPPYFYIVRRGGLAYRFYLSDEGADGDFIKKLKEKYPGMISGYPKILALIGTDEQLEEREEYENNLPSSCAAYDKDNCETNEYFACIWNENQFGKYCNTDKLLYVRCGGSFDIPYETPKVISFIITFLKVIVPIILIFVATMSLLKSIGSANEDEIKKAQKSLVRKIVAGVLSFFVISIVQFVIMKVAETEDGASLSNCLSCFMNNDCDGTVYYKTNVGGTYLCTDFAGTSKPCDDYYGLTN